MYRNMEKKKSLQNIWQNPPKINEIDTWDIPQPQRLELDNQIPVNYFHKEGLEFFRLDIVWRSGRSYEQHKLMGKAVSSLIKEGSAHISSDELDEIVDRYGAELSFKAGMDFSRISLLGIRQFFEPLCRAVSQLIEEPQFANKDIKNFIRRNKDKLRVNLVNADVVAFRTLTEQIYGTEHPYGYNSSKDMFQAIKRQDIVNHYKRCYIPSNAHVFLTTHIDKPILKTLNQSFGRFRSQNNHKPENLYWEPKLSGGNQTKILLNHPHQSMIQIGKKLFNRKHEDFYKMYMVSTLLGGYFGSRLMKNIREKKGYTYNIYSSVDGMLNSGYFSISTEVSHENIDKVLTLIHREVEKIQSELVPEKELRMVKNYLLGYSLNMLDGPFNIMEMVRVFIMQTGGTESYSEMMNTIQHITAEEIRDISMKYLNAEGLTTIIVT